jgi:uncharacterized membrane protein YkoI
MKLALPYFLRCYLIFMVAHSTYSLASGGVLSAATMQVNHQGRSTTKQQANVISSQQAAHMAKSRFGGKVLKVQKQNTGYRVKLIKNDGNIVSVYVDAKSGRISGGN